MIRYEIFSDSRIELQREVSNHPILVERLANHPAEEFELKLAEIASYCNIVLHGDYSQEDIDEICERLTGILRGKLNRLIVVN